MIFATSFSTREGSLRQKSFSTRFLAPQRSTMKERSVLYMHLRSDKTYTGQDCWMTASRKCNSTRIQRRS
jgi:hypothetical protein